MLYCIPLVGQEEALVKSKEEIEALQERAASLSVQLIEREEKIQQLQEDIKGTLPDMVPVTIRPLL